MSLEDIDQQIKHLIQAREQALAKKREEEEELKKRGRPFIDETEVAVLDQSEHQLFLELTPCDSVGKVSISWSMLNQYRKVDKNFRLTRQSILNYLAFAKPGQRSMSSLDDEIYGDGAQAKTKSVLRVPVETIEPIPRLVLIVIKFWLYLNRFPKEVEENKALQWLIYPHLLDMQLYEACKMLDVWLSSTFDAKAQLENLNVLSVQVERTFHGAEQQDEKVVPRILKSMNSKKYKTTQAPLFTVEHQVRLPLINSTASRWPTLERVVAYALSDKGEHSESFTVHLQLPKVRLLFVTAVDELRQSDLSLVENMVQEVMKPRPNLHLLHAVNECCFAEGGMDMCYDFWLHVLARHHLLSDMSDLPVRQLPPSDRFNPFALNTFMGALRYFIEAGTGLNMKDQNNFLNILQLTMKLIVLNSCLLRDT